MGIFGKLFGHDSYEDTPELLSAIERAVCGVEPLLRQINGYPEYYRKPVATALEYAHSLAASVPGPVLIDRESYAKDAFVHVIFPDIDSINEAIRSSMAMQDYLRDFPVTDQLYALMGMRRFEKSMTGMELAGQTIQRDVVQKTVYFTSHTLENPAPSEQQARERVAASFFDSLVRKVKKRIEERRHNWQSQQLEKELLKARLHEADARDRPALQAEFDRLINSMQATLSSLEPGNFKNDFEEVLLNPAQHLRLVQKSVFLDSMGIRRNVEENGRAREFLFNELIGYDRRDWTVTIVRCNNLQKESFAERLDKAYRRLVI